MRENIFNVFCTQDGPNLDRLLHNLDDLEIFVVDPKFHDFIEVLRLFHEVQVGCFGMDLADDWEARIHVFMEAYMALGISVTPKAHTIFYEIPIFIWEVGLALGHFAAQHFETGHFDFEETLNRFKRKETHPEHGDQQTSACANYAAEHV